MLIPFWFLILKQTTWSLTWSCFCCPPLAPTPSTHPTIYSKPLIPLFFPQHLENGMGWWARLSITVARGTCTQSAQGHTSSNCRGLSSPKEVHREGQVTANGTGTVCDEFSSWYKSYFLNNSSLNIVVFSRYLKPLSMSCFSITGLQVASCLQTLLVLAALREVWKDLSLLLFKLQGHVGQEKGTFQMILSPAGTAGSPSQAAWQGQLFLLPRPCCSQPQCACK